MSITISFYTLLVQVTLHGLLWFLIGQQIGTVLSVCCYLPTQDRDSHVRLFLNANWVHCMVAFTETMLLLY